MKLIEEWLLVSFFLPEKVANALSVYYLVKQMGIPDSNIILMLSDDIPCNARNPFPGQVFHDVSHDLNIYGEEVEVDYRGGEVTVENFIRLLRYVVGLHVSSLHTAILMRPHTTFSYLVLIAGAQHLEHLHLKGYFQMKTAT